MICFEVFSKQKDILLKNKIGYNKLAIMTVTATRAVKTVLLILEGLTTRVCQKQRKILKNILNLEGLSFSSYAMGGS